MADCPGNERRERVVAASTARRRQDSRLGSELEDARYPYGRRDKRLARATSEFRRLTFVRWSTSENGRPTRRISMEFSFGMVLTVRTPNLEANIDQEVPRTSLPRMHSQTGHPSLRFPRGGQRITLARPWRNGHSCHDW